MPFWFPPEDLGLAFGVLHTIGRCGTAVHFVIMPLLYNVTNELSFPLWIGFALYGGLMMLCFIVIFMSAKAEREGRMYLEIREDNGNAETIWELMFSCRFYSMEFWILAVLCGLFYGSMMIFTSISSGFLNARFHYDSVTAGTINVFY